MNRILHRTSTSASRKLRTTGTYRSSRHNAHVYSSRLMMSVISTTSSSSFSSSTSPSPSANAKQHHRRQYHHCLQADKSSSCCTPSATTSSIFPIECQRAFGTSSSSSTSSSSDDENGHDEEEWIPPQRPIGKKSTTTSSSTTTTSSTTTDTYDSTNVVTGGVSATNNSQQQEQAQLYTQQRRIDEATDALFVLTPEEEATLTDEELSRRVDEVLALEEELEQQAFEMELQQLELQNESEEEEKEDQEEDDHVNSSAEPTIDWLQTRRAALGESNDKNSDDNSSSSKLSSSSSSVIPIEEHTLLTRDEILTLLEFYGGHDMVVIDDDVQHPRMGGADGMIFCSTSPSSSSSNNGVINSPMYQYQQTFRVMALTRGLVEHMKERGLHEIGVPGAQLSLGKKSQQPGSQSSRRSGGSAGLGSSLESSSSSWQIIDCRNYIVHIMDPMTRSKFRLEALWTGKDPIWKLDWTDEDAVDKYVGDQQKQQRYDDDDNAGTGNPWDDGRLIHRLERTSFSTARHRPVIASSTKNRDRRAGRRQRRRLREQQFRSR